MKNLILLAMLGISSVSSAEGMSATECLKRGAAEARSDKSTTAYDIMNCSNENYSTCYVYSEATAAAGSKYEFKSIQYVGGDEIYPLNSSYMSADDTMFFGLRSAIDHKACLDDAQSAYCYKISYDIKKKTLRLMSIGSGYSETVNLTCKSLR